MASYTLAPPSQIEFLIPGSGFGLVARLNLATSVVANNNLIGTGINAKRTVSSSTYFWLTKLLYYAKLINFKLSKGNIYLKHIER